MSLKAIVIEDEVIIRKGIVQKVQWEKFDITEVLETSDGETGYQMILKEKPDIILLDINLPRMNGIEILKKIREQNISSKVIILSGHDEFSYAQKAIEYGVENYLLKPCSAKKIENILEEICNNINIDQKKNNNYLEMKKKLKDMIPFFRSGFINRIISGDITNKEEILNLSTYLGLNLKNNFFIVVVIIIEPNIGGRNNLEVEFIRELGMYQLISDITDESKAIVECSMSGKATLIISGNDEASTKKYCFSLIDEIKKNILEEISSKITFGIGEVKNNIEDIRQSYSEAINALENRFIDGFNQVYYIGDISLQTTDTSGYPYEEEKKFMQSIKNGQEKNSLDSLNNIIEFLKRKKDKYPVRLAKIQLKRIAYYLIQVVFELEGNVSDIYGKIDIYKNIESFLTIDEYEKFIIEFTKKLSQYISKRRYIKHTSSTRKAILFIEENYNNDELNLEKIADHVEMHPNYVSHLFKKEKGESLSSYICRYRVKKAEELIIKHPTLKIYDIAYEVGFSDPNYFTTCFKNIIGVSPTEYRQLNQ